MDVFFVTCTSCGARNRIPADKSHLQARCGKCGSRLPAGGDGRVIELDERNFDQVVSQSPMPVLVDFYSPTCGPCRMLAPVIEDLARQYAGRLRVAKLDTSRHRGPAVRFDIRGVPTLIFFHHGRQVDQVVGAAPREQIEQKIKALL